MRESPQHVHGNPIREYIIVGTSPTCPKLRFNTTDCPHTLLSVPDKILAQNLLDRVRQKLLTHKRHEHFGFKPKNSTAVDRIQALCSLSGRLRDFRIGLVAACVNRRKAFDSMNRDVLWRILPLHGITPKLVNLISGLYSGTE